MMKVSATPKSKSMTLKQYITLTNLRKRVAIRAKSKDKSQLMGPPSPERSLTETPLDDLNSRISKQRSSLVSEIRMELSQHVSDNQALAHLLSLLDSLVSAFGGQIKELTDQNTFLMGLLHTNNVKVKKSQSYCVAAEMGLYRADTFNPQTMPEIPMSASRQLEPQKKDSQVIEVITFSPTAKKNKSKNESISPVKDQNQEGSAKKIANAFMSFAPSNESSNSPELGKKESSGSDKPTALQKRFQQMKRRNQR